ncbi:polysaccharide biosynthesis tyrosine autokinase [Paraconexibacter sp.]|uniref:polysaccharide biosynthesis tyrosine autokinase n=1 Tax=Paraconexibacter sp. TaxID=2949640 RepID=UPI0035684BF7
MELSSEERALRQEASALVSAARVLRERWWIVAGSVAVCLIISLGLSLTATKEYSATSRLLVGQATTDLTALIDSGSVRTLDPQRVQGTALKLVTSTEVAGRVKEQLKLPDDADSLAAQVSPEAEADTDLISVTATDPDPERARALANAFANEYVAYRTAADRQRLAEGERLLTRQIASLSADDVTQRAQLSQALQKITALRVVSTGDAEVVDRALLPGTPTSPKPRRDAILGLMFGLAIGIGITFMIDLFDRRVKSIEDFEDLYGFRALTSIPLRPRDPTTQRDRQAALEPFRILRNGLGLLGGPGEVRVVLVSSAVPAEGKSTVAAGLARAIALSGQSVALVEVDLRRPTFHQQFDLGGDTRGLTSALVGGIPVRDLLRPVLPGLRTLQVLPSGPLPPNSAELLRSPEMGALLSELAAEVDVVILDAPPLLPVADSQVLLDHPQVDACLIVARAYQTTRDEARRTRAVLDRHRLRNLGLVVNGIRGLDSGYDYYGSSEPDAQGSTRMSRA